MTTPSEHPVPAVPPVPDDELVAGDLTAAMLEGQLTVEDQLPPALAARIVASGEVLVRAHAVPSILPPATSSAAISSGALAERSARASRGTRWVGWSGWLAAAALLALMVQSRSDGARGSSAAMVSAVDPRLALRDSLLATPGVARRAWSPTADRTAAGATGEVVWDPATQRGIMRFVGLSPNARDGWQYQLWIFDAERDERYPVDGGVFDVPPQSGEVIVPIRARLPVGRAVLFAVTVEAPGGVVVSRRDRIAVTARL